MADKTVRKLIAEPEFDTLVTFVNALRDDVKNRASLIHEDDNAVDITAAAATDQATSNTLLNDAKVKYNLHRARTDAHVAADATNTVVVADAVDLATSGALANDLKAKFNLHVAQAGVHINNDAGTVTAANFVSTLAEVQTLANDIKAKFNAHKARIFSSLKLVRGRA